MSKASRKPGGGGGSFAERVRNLVLT
eukprot:SAG11_NODE_29478_length_310_cov_0.990521_1_plen_25_part_01